jgi:hypothetical protein
MKATQMIKLLLVFCVNACVNKTSTKADNTAKAAAAMTTGVSAPAAMRAGTSTPDSPATGQIIDSVICRSDATQSYALYIPAKGGKSVLPVIYFFDSHGDGALPLSKYKSLADEYGFILVGSNNSRNGTDWPATENIWRNLSGDTRSRLRIDSNRIYTCGFSGGAKVAGYVAIMYPGVKGVIANGAGLPDGVPAGDFDFSFTAIAGEGDMNLTDLVAITNDLDKSRTRHRIIFFDGIHEWAPENTMSQAFAGLQLDAMRQAFIPKDEVFINRYIEQSKRRLDVYYQSNQLVKAGQECKISISFLDGLTGEAGWFANKAASLAASASYQKEIQAQEALLVKEQNMKDGYMEHFQQDNMPYWITTIGDLQAKAKEKTAERAMYQRLLAYLSLAFYSFSNRLINSNGNNGARHFVELYKMADPTNSEAWYFSAILDEREGHAQAAENDLRKAVECGFRDKNRMMQQAEFKNLQIP